MDPEKVRVPAFPVPMIPSDREGGHTEVRWEGMSLRDYFAAKAMQAWITRVGQEWVAESAYQIADAMLAQREKP